MTNFGTKSSHSVLAVNTGKGWSLFETDIFTSTGIRLYTAQTVTMDATMLGW